MPKPILVDAEDSISIVIRRQAVLESRGYLLTGQEGSCLVYEHPEMGDYLEVQERHDKHMAKVEEFWKGRSEGNGSVQKHH